MAISLHNFETPKKKSKKRVGRGLGSTGTTSGRGQKGQKSRAGASGFQRLGIRKLMLATPKLRGFKSPNKAAAVVNVKDLSQAFAKGEPVTPKTLEQKGLIATKANGVKILGIGEMTHEVAVKGCAVSKSAAEKILGAGGTIAA